MFILEGAETFGELKKDPNRFGFVFVPKGDDNVWCKKKLNSRYRYRWKEGSNKKKLPIQFINNIQHSYSNRDTGKKRGREFDGIVCFLERCKGEELVLCARLGQDFCPLHLQEDGKHATYDCNIVIKKEEHDVWHNVNQISGNNEWQHGHHDKMKDTVNSRDLQIQESKAGPDICPGFGTGAATGGHKRSKKRNKEHRKAEKEWKKCKENKGVTLPVHQFFSHYMTFKNKAVLFDEAAKSHVGRYCCPNPAQLNQEKMQFFLPPKGTNVNKLKQNKQFASPENAEQELLKFCEPVEFEIIDIDANETQYFVDSNGDVVSAFFGTALADKQIYSRLKETEIEDFFKRGKTVVDKSASRNVCKAGGLQIFGPYCKTEQAGTFATKGLADIRKDGLLRERASDYVRKGNNNDEHARHSKLLNKHGNFAADAQNKLLPFQMQGNNFYFGGHDCDINIQSILFFNTIHKDPDARHKEQQIVLKKRILKLEEKLKKLTDYNDVECLKEYIAAQKSMVKDTFTTCTWMLEEKDEWELFVYFIFPASRIALRLNNKCALSFKGARNFHATSIAAAVHRHTKEVRFLVDRDESFGSINAWGRSGGTSKKK